MPIQFLKALLPDPASLGPRPVGKTNIGCIFTGKKDGKEKTIYIYNAVSYTHLDVYKRQVQSTQKITKSWFFIFGISIQTI